MRKSKNGGKMGRRREEERRERTTKDREGIRGHLVFLHVPIGQVRIQL